MNDDGIQERYITSEVELNLDEIMMKFNESDIWFISKTPFCQPWNTKWYVDLVDEIKNDPKYSNLFNEQARRLQQAKITQHKFEIRVAAKTYKE
jgi:hypothetical protein